MPHTNEVSAAIRYCGAIYHDVHSDSTNVLSLCTKSVSVTIHTRSNETYFPVVLFIKLCKWFHLINLSTKSLIVAIRAIKAIDHVLSVVFYHVEFELARLVIDDGNENVRKQ